MDTMAAMSSCRRASHRAAFVLAGSLAPGVKVIYTLRLRGNTNPRDDAATAKYVMTHYDRYVVCSEIGNEPNVYAKAYPAYHDLMARFVDAITAADVAPGARFCGPNTTPGKTEWARQLAIDSPAPAVSRSSPSTPIPAATPAR
jgi:hypothetical protein